VGILRARSVPLFAPTQPLWHDGGVPEAPYINRFRVQKYRCIQDCELKLTRLHALVGPNDSGKSTLLRALELGQRMFAANGLLTGQTSSTEFELGWQDGIAVRRWDAVNTTMAEWTQAGKVVAKGTPNRGFGIDAGDPRHGHARLLRLDPDEMSKPTQLIPSASGIAFESDRGFGLPGVYDALLARKRRAFDAIEQSLIKLFPHVESLVLTSLSTSTKQLGVQLKGRSEPINAPELS
jgi:energy-coupling factor transporter ATP-binding protein EcfA2